MNYNLKQFEIWSVTGSQDLYEAATLRAVAKHAQTCALGSAIAAAVVAGAYKDYATAQKRMTGLKPKIYKPNLKAHATYRELYALYKQLHDAFGTRKWNGDLYGIMKKLIEIRSRVRK
jgi:L-ribulokinase